MAGFDVRRQWWVVVLVVGTVALGALAVVDRWLPRYEVIATIAAFGIIGALFLWAYAIDTERQWWAIIPGLGAFTLLAAILADLVFGTDPENDWASVLVIGLGAAIIAAVVKRRDARVVIIIVAVISLLVGVTMAPIAAALKVALIAADVVVGAYLAWRSRGGRVAVS